MYSYAIDYNIIQYNIVLYYNVLLLYDSHYHNIIIRTRW